MRPIALTLALLAALLLCSPPAAAASSSTWRWPVQGPVITPYRNGGDPYAGGQHRGIDIAAPIGAPVAASTGGTVTFAGIVGSSGLTVVVATDDGRFEVSYLHLSSIAVAAGARVVAGDRLGAVGTSGRRSAARPHLHLGVREAGSRFAYRDPLDFLPAPAPPEPSPPPPAPRAVPSPVAVPIEPHAALVPGLAAVIASPRASDVPGLSAAVAAPLAAVAGPAAAVAANGQVGAAAPAATAPSAGGGGAPLTPRRSHPGAPPRQAAHSAPAHPPAARRSRRDGQQATAGGAAPLPAAGPVGHGVDAPPAAAVASSTPAVLLKPRAARASGSHGHGIDAGWLAACVGMVAAAGLLGRPVGAARSLRRAFELPAAGSRSEEARSA